MPSACAWIWPKAPTIWSCLLMLKAWSRSIHCTSSWLLPYEPVLVTSVKSNGGAMEGSDSQKHPELCIGGCANFKSSSKWQYVESAHSAHSSHGFQVQEPPLRAVVVSVHFPEKHSFMTSVVNWNQGGMMQDACKVKIKFQNFNSDVKIACSRGPFKGHWVNQGHSN